MFLAENARFSADGVCNAENGTIREVWRSGSGSCFCLQGGPWRTLQNHNERLLMGKRVQNMQKHLVSRNVAIEDDVVCLEKEEWSGYPAFCPQVANSEMLWDKTCTPWKFLKYYFQRVYCCISGISCCLELSESSDWDNRAYKYVRSLNDLQSLRFALECFHSTKQNDSDGLRKWDMHCQEERDNLIIFYYTFWDIWVKFASLPLFSWVDFTHWRPWRVNTRLTAWAAGQAGPNAAGMDQQAPKHRTIKR